MSIRYRTSIALLGLSLGAPAAAAGLGGISSAWALQAERSAYGNGSAAIDFTSIDLLTAETFEQRKEGQGELVSLHPDVLLPVPIGSGRVRIAARGLRLDRIYYIRYRPENIALELTNVGKPLQSTLLVATLTGRGSVRKLYGSIPDFRTGASRRLLLSASTPIANQRMTIHLRPWRKLAP